MSIEVKDLSFSYGEREVLHDVSFSVEAGEFLSILGPNGVGKSTLFRCVLGLLRDYRGSITVEGRDARSLSIRESAKLIAYIPQSSHPAFNYSVRDIVLMGTTSGLGTFSTPKKEDLRRVDEVNMEYQVDLLYQPNDRWIVNGNFGYRQNNNQIEDYNQYITDVDIEYLLTQSGKLRLKFYNHTIDRMAQLRTAKNTQGAGVVYKEDFDSVIDMFRYYWRKLMSIGKKKKATPDP